ncbi:MAG TPA: bifunctional sugar-1-phosphate nucleotidylyltransferase/acetyltransferase [Methanomassiliicoccales archaeon]|nr:bifunctional sugar-1-phosphate nucleotidylyltransferase/acetyltransferase [Methanomassiliicoccales archaeon]
MQAVILAAGEGTRLRPFTSNRPKVMLPIGNRPILEHVVESLVANGIKDIILVVGYKKERIMSFFGDGSKFKAHITYIIQEKQLGTAHAMTYLKGVVKGEFLVLPGDNIVDQEMVASLLGLEEKNAILVTESDEPSKYGVVTLHDQYVVSIQEKPADSVGNIINTGLYLLDAKLMPRFESEVKQGNYGIPDVLRSLLHEVPIKAVMAKGRWDDAVYPWDLIRLNEIALESRGQELLGMIEPGVNIKGSVSIGRGTRVRSGTYIEGPVVIGEGCDIGPSVAILPSTSIGNGVSVDPFTTIKNSIIGNNVNIGPQSYVHQSVIDDNVRIGAGVMCSAGRASIKIDERYHDVPKIGCMVGEETEIGSSVVLSSGTVVGAGSRIRDGAKVAGIIENRSIVI